MKTTCKISVREEEVCRECLEAVFDVYPEGRKAARFELRFPQGDRKISEAVALLESFGLKMPSGAFSRGKEFINIIEHSSGKDRVCNIRVYESNVPKECVAALAKKYPEARCGSFQLELPEGHPVIPKVIKVLESHGYKMPPNGFFRTHSIKGYIRIEYIRDFDETDLNAAKYLYYNDVSSDLSVWTDGRTARGNIAIKAESISRRCRIVGDSCGAFLVTDSVHKGFLKEKFKHLQFRRCEVVGPKAEEFEDYPIWELTSDLTLPKVSPTCKYYSSDDGLPVPNASKQSVPHDGLHWPALVRYRAKDIQKVEPFDVAHLWEPSFLNLGFWREIIVSQRFYQFCLKNKYKISVTPVILED